MSGFVACLDHWQTLISGGLAVAAAGGGAYLLSKQIAQSDKHERERRRAQLASARAVLPLALDEVASFAEVQMNAFASLHSECVNWAIGQQKPAFSRSKLAENVISLLREAIEAMEANGKFRALELLSDIICEIQIVRARAEGVESYLRTKGPSGLPLQLEEHIVLCARLYALVLGLLPFARRADDDGPPAITWNDANNCLQSADIRIPGIGQILERRLQASHLTWESKVVAPR